MKIEIRWITDSFKDALQGDAYLSSSDLECIHITSSTIWRNSESILYDASAHRIITQASPLSSQIEHSALLAYDKMKQDLKKAAI